MNPITRIRIQTCFLILLASCLLAGKGQAQTTQNQGQKPQQKSQSITPEQTAKIKTILSAYKPASLTAADAKAIHAKFREAGIHGGPETNDAIRAAGFDPEQLRSLDPPPGDGKSGKPGMSPDDRMAKVESGIIKPLSLNTTQSDVIRNAFKLFFADEENLRKSLGNPQGPVDKSKMEPLVKKRDDKVKAALSSDQYKKYQDLEKSLHPQPDNKSGSNAR
jgi:hypothetical protein